MRCLFLDANLGLWRFRFWYGLATRFTVALLLSPEALLAAAEEGEAALPLPLAILANEVDSYHMS